MFFHRFSDVNFTFFLQPVDLSFSLPFPTINISPFSPYDVHMALLRTKKLKCVHGNKGLTKRRFGARAGKARGAVASELRTRGRQKGTKYIPVRKGLQAYLIISHLVIFPAKTSLAPKHAWRFALPFAQSPENRGAFIPDK